MDDLEGLSLRELLTRARERLGGAAAALKTREEVVTALTAHPDQAGATAGTSGEPSVVTRDFFHRREG